jgi:hypothetical protein
MRGPSYALTAAGLGAIGFGAVEWVGRARGVRTALSSSLWIDLSAFVVAAVLLALLYRTAWQAGRGRRIAAALAHVALYPFVVAWLAGLADLTVRGGWTFPGEVRTALIAGPVNLLATFTVELGWLALPAAAVATVVLVAAARTRRA